MLLNDDNSSAIEIENEFFAINRWDDGDGIGEPSDAWAHLCGNGLDITGDGVGSGDESQSIGRLGCDGWGSGNPSTCGGK
jgi:hypothetical protein